MEYYKTKIAPSKNVELVHVSCDDDEEGMKSFLAPESARFPVISSSKADKIKTLKELSPRGIPHYVLVDANGNVVSGESGAKEKAAELAAGTIKKE